MQTRATTRYWFSHHQTGKNFRASQCREWRESGETQALVHSVQTQVGTDLKERLVVSCEAGDAHAQSKMTPAMGLGLPNGNVKMQDIL